MLIIVGRPIEPPAVVVQPKEVAAPEADRLGAELPAAAERLAKADQPMTLRDPERPWVSHLVSRDLAAPDVWRHTEMVDGEPFLDKEFTAAEDAFLSALRAGGLPAS